MSNRFPIICFLQILPAVLLSFACWGSAEAADSPGQSTVKRPSPVTVDQNFSRMVKIPAGRFKMGSTFQRLIKSWNQCLKVDKNCREWWFKDELPEHKVYLDEYWIDIFEVTNADYIKFVSATGHRPALDDSCRTRQCRDGNLWDGTTYPESIRNQPVVQVSWHDADAYCRWRGKRLPTEAEWEKAARGPAGNFYPWGNDAPTGRATYKRKWHGPFTMTNTGSYSNGASMYGVYDMAGNAWEWVADWYDATYYRKSPKKNPPGPAEGQFKVVRGGSWVNYAITLRSSLRRWSRPEVRFNDTGFRCVKDAVHETQTNR